jgi:steroid 5-alpha reductase family enzyme
MPEGDTLVTAAMTALAGLGAILTILTFVWALSVKLRDASIADVCWGSGFVLLVWLYCLLSPTLTSRSWLVAALITLWGARLSVHIFRRNHGKGEDPRYRAMRASYGPAFCWRSLFIVFWLQGAILWFVALPILVAVRAVQPAALTAVDALGVMLFAVGFGFEVVGDYQLERFKAAPANRGHVFDRGLWRYTRHPNYFGDATL